MGITVEGLTDNEGERVTCSFTEQMSDVRREELAKYIPVETRLFHDMTAAGYNQKLKLGQNVFYLSLNMKSIMGIITGPVRSDICVLKKMEDVVIAVIMDVLMRIAIH